MPSKCTICNQPLTDPISQRRGMGGDCAAKHLQLTAPNEEELIAGLEQLALDHPTNRTVREMLAEAKAIRFRQIDDSQALIRLIDWHYTSGRRVAPIPDHLDKVTRAVVAHLLNRIPLMRALHMWGCLVENRRDALKLMAELGTVIPEVLALVEVNVPEAPVAERNQVV